MSEDKKDSVSNGYPKPVDSEGGQLPVRSYWYPDRLADLSEVKVGYKAWRSNVRLMFFLFFPILLVILSILVYKSSEFWEFYLYIEEQLRKTSREKDFYLNLSMLVVKCPHGSDDYSLCDD